MKKFISFLGGLKLAPTSEKEIRSKIGKKYIESMAVADKSVVDFHGKESVARYVLALMNVVRICCVYTSRTNVASAGSVLNDTRKVKVLSLPETIKEKSTF